MSGLIPTLLNYSLLQQHLLEHFALRAFWGVECELYIFPALDDAALSKLGKDLQLKIPLFEKLEREKGVGQLEFSLNFTSDISALIAQFEQCKNKILQHHPLANFLPKPYAHQAGSGLHVHIHLENGQGKRVFYKDDETISDTLKHSIAGLLEQLPNATEQLWRNEDDRARILSDAPDIPRTISWGANNRSCAIRLPDKPRDQKHIEYRIAGANADLELVISLMLEGIIHGLETKPSLPPQIYGNANDTQYGLKKLL